MGVTTWPCPGCGQQQRAVHENGQEISLTLCPACAEHFAGERDQILAEPQGRKEKALQLQLLAQRYGVAEQDAKNFAQLCLAEQKAAENN
jgi:hypothetical protein